MFADVKLLVKKKKKKKETNLAENMFTLYS